MQIPPQTIPYPFDSVGILPWDDFRNLARDDVVDCPAVSADRESIARAFRPFAITQAHGDDFEIAHDAMHAVGQHARQRNPIVAGLEGSDFRHARRSDQSPEEMGGTVRAASRGSCLPKPDPAMTTRNRNAPRMTDCQ